MVVVRTFVLSCVGVLLNAMLLSPPAIAADAKTTDAKIQDAKAQETVLQGIQITEKEDSVTLQVDLSIPLHYMRHFPPTAGEILQIQLVNPVETTPTPAEDPTKQQKDMVKRESLLPPATDVVPLTNVTYEGDVPGGPFLTLRFKFPVEYTVAEGSGGRSILVVVKKDAGGLTVRANQEGTLPSDEKLNELMEEIRQTLAREDFGRAIQLLSRLLALPAHAHSQEAKELMGVARERKGQIARAKLEYQEYLRLYPEGEGAERVKQRLAAIELSQVQPKEKLKEVKSKTAAEQIETFGRFSQRYYQDNTHYSFDTPSSTSASLTSYLNLSSRYRNEEYDVRGFFNAHNIHVTAGGGKDDSEINTAYVDVKNKEKKYSTSVGRQSSNKGGVFGRYDGVWGSYELEPKYELSATFGKPVEFSHSDIVANKFFYGTTLAVGTFDNWDGNIYYIEQKVEGIVDRRGIGGDLRYSDKIYTFFNSIDYDISYNKLNIWFVRGGWKINDQARLDVNYSLRQSPLLLTSNALQQENGITSFKALLDQTTESDIRAIVPKLSSFSRMLTVGAVYELDQNNQINADVSVSSLDAKPEVRLLIAPNPGTPDAPENFIAASPKYGPEYSYSVQLISSNYYIERDIHILGGRFTTGAQRNTTSLFIRSRFPYGDQWYIGPRIQFDRTQNDTSTDTSLLSRPSAAVKLDYKWRKDVSFEAELAYEQNKYSGGTTTTPDYTRTTLFLGYNVDF